MNGRLLKTQEVLKVLPIGRTTFLTGVSRGIYPAPLRIGRRLFWRQSDIEKMLSDFSEGLLSTPTGGYLPMNHSDDETQGGEDSAIFRQVRAENIDRVNSSPDSPLLLLGTPPSPPQQPKMRAPRV